MPSLNVTFYGNAGPLDAVMTQQTSKIKAFQKAIAQSSLSESAKQQAYQKLAFDEELNRHFTNNTPARQNIRRRRAQEEMANIASGSIPENLMPLIAGEKAAKGIAEGLKSGGHAAGGMSTIMRETLVIFREIGRGNWARVPGSISILVQALGQLKNISLLTLGAWGFAIASPFIAAYTWLKRTNGLAEKLAGFKLPDLSREHLAHIDQATEGWRKIAEAAKEALKTYNGATEAAGRHLEIIKATFDHAKAMNDLAKERELVTAFTPSQKFAIEQHYSDLELENNRRQRAAELGNKKDELWALNKEIAATSAEANKITVPDSEHHQRTMNDFKNRAEAAQQYLAAIREADRIKSEGGVDSLVQSAKEQAVKTFYGGTAQFSTRDALEAAKAKAVQEANAYIQTYNQQIDKDPEWQRQNAKREKLQADAAEKASKAIELQGDINNQSALDDLANANDAELASSRLSLEKQRLQFGGGNVLGDLTGNQRIGAYSMPGTTTLIDFARQQVDQQKQTNLKLDTLIQKPAAGIPGYGGN